MLELVGRRVVVRRRNGTKNPEIKNEFGILLHVDVELGWIWFLEEKVRDDSEQEEEDEPMDPIEKMQLVLLLKNAYIAVEPDLYHEDYQKVLSLDECERKLGICD